MSKRPGDLSVQQGNNKSPRLVAPAATGTTGSGGQNIPRSGTPNLVSNHVPRPAPAKTAITAAAVSGSGDYVPFLVDAGTDLAQARFKLHKEGADFLRSVPAPVAVVGVIGELRTGKSYLVNAITGAYGPLASRARSRMARRGTPADKPVLFVSGNGTVTTAAATPMVPTGGGFKVSSGSKGCTRGLWLCKRYIRRPNEQGDGYVSIVFMDIEGLNDTAGSPQRSLALFLLGNFLSSMVIYNCKGAITDSTLRNMYLVSKLAIQLNSGMSGRGGGGEHDSKEEGKEEEAMSEEDKERMNEFLPTLFYLMRDRGLKVTPDYLEEILAVSPSDEVAARDNPEVAKKIEIQRALKQVYKVRHFDWMVAPGNARVLETMDTPAGISCLDPDFIEDYARVEENIIRLAPPKRTNGALASGSALCMLAERLLGDKGIIASVPPMRDTWEVMAAEQLRSAGDTAIDLWTSNAPSLAARARATLRNTSTTTTHTALPQQQQQQQQQSSLASSRNNNRPGGGGGGAGGPTLKVNLQPQQVGVLQRHGTFAPVAAKKQQQQQQPALRVIKWAQPRAFAKLANELVDRCLTQFENCVPKGTAATAVESARGPLSERLHMLCRTAIDLNTRDLQKWVVQEWAPDVLERTAASFIDPPSPPPVATLAAAKKTEVNLRPLAAAPAAGAKQVESKKQQHQEEKNNNNINTNSAAGSVSTAATALSGVAAVSAVVVQELDPLVFAELRAAVWRSVADDAQKLAGEVCQCPAPTIPEQDESEGDNPDAFDAVDYEDALAAIECLSLSAHETTDGERVGKKTGDGKQAVTGHSNNGSGGGGGGVRCVSAFCHAARLIVGSRVWKWGGRAIARAGYTARCSAEEEGRKALEQASKTAQATLEQERETQLAAKLRAETEAKEAQCERDAITKSLEETRRAHAEKAAQATREATAALEEKLRLEEELAKLQTETAAREAESKVATAEAVAVAQSEATSHRNALERLRDDLESARSRITESEESLISATRDAETARAQAKRIQAEATRKAEEVAQRARTEIEAARAAQRREKERDQARMQKAIEEAEKRAEDAIAEARSEAKRELQEVQKNHAAIITEQKETMRAAQARIAELTDTNEALRIDKDRSDALQNVESTRRREKDEKLKAEVVEHSSTKAQLAAAQTRLATIPAIEAERDRALSAEAKYRRTADEANRRAAKARLDLERLKIEVASSSSSSSSSLSGIHMDALTNYTGGGNGGGNGGDGMRHSMGVKQQARNNNVYGSSRDSSSSSSSSSSLQTSAVEDEYIEQAINDEDLSEEVAVATTTTPRLAASTTLSSKFSTTSKTSPNGQDILPVVKKTPVPSLGPRRR